MLDSLSIRCDLLQDQDVVVAFESVQLQSPAITKGLPECPAHAPNASEATAHELADLEHCGTAPLRQSSRRIIEEKHRAECAAFRPRLNALQKTLLTNRLGSVDEPIAKLRSSAPPKHRKRAQERAPAPFRPFHSQVGPKVYPKLGLSVPVATSSEEESTIKHNTARNPDVIPSKQTLDLANRLAWLNALEAFVSVKMAEAIEDGVTDGCGDSTADDGSASMAPLKRPRRLSHELPRRRSLPPIRDDVNVDPNAHED